MSNKNDHVKLLVHIKPEDGYPPEEWESLWAVPVGKSLFRIDNIPFYARGLSCGDVVEATKKGNEYIFVKVVRPSTYSTIRVIIYDLENEGRFRDTLEAFGCAIEGVGIPGLIAINVPRAAKTGVKRFLEQAFAAEQLDFEEGVLR